MIALKIVKYLEINLTKDVKDLYSENCKALMKKLTKGQINRKPACAHGENSGSLRWGLEGTGPHRLTF